MTHDEYAALVSRLEAMAAAKPTSYRLRVGALAVLGYAYALGIMLLLALSLAALPLVKALVEGNADHASGLYMLGRMLLAVNDDAGLAYLERAMHIDPSAAGPASSLTAAHLQRAGRSQESIAYRTRSEASVADEAAAQAERRSIAKHDQLATADLEEPAHVRLREQLAQYPKASHGSDER